VDVFLVEALDLLLVAGELVLGNCDDLLQGLSNESRLQKAREKCRGEG
jgi:hypothetical protein